MPEGAEPLVGFDLTTHRGHFMGSGHNRLVLYTHEGRTWVKAAGTWDPMPWHLDKAYRVGRQRGPARVLGPGRRRGAEHAAPARDADRAVTADAVVIGAGPNGLAAAIRLAEAGRSVLVLEAADAPGGAVRTEELTLPGFKHDTFSSVYPARAASPVFARMPLAEHGLEWVHPAAATRTRCRAARRAALSRPGRDRRGARLASAGDGEHWVTFVRPFLDNFDAVRGDDALRLPAARRPAEAARPAPGRCGCCDFARMLPGSAVGLGKRLFERRRLAGLAVRRGDARRHAARRRRQRRSRPFYLNLLGHAVGWPSPRGGAERLTDALVSYFESLGGERAHRRARRAHRSSADGRVTGVAPRGRALRRRRS